MELLDGTKVSAKRLPTLRKEVESFTRKPALAVILVGSNPASLSYVGMKKKRCEAAGIACTIHQFPDSAQQVLIEQRIHELNSDVHVTGILVQLPLPKHMQTRTILDSVAIAKDADGLHSYHLMKLLLGDEEIIPCTPKGILSLLETYHIPLKGKTVCVIGFSDVVGKPLATACLNRGATVTVCTSKTKDLRAHTSAADVVMTATGVPNLIKADMVAQGAVVIDIGISKVGTKIVGDVDFEHVHAKCSYITPVPGGVGPMTIISLIENVIQLHKKQRA